MNPLNDTVRITGTDEERHVLREALLAYDNNARLRYEPNFVPKPGKKDRNLETMRICEQLLGKCTSGLLAMLTTDEERRVIRQALQNYASKVDAGDTTDNHSASVAMGLSMRVPFTGEGDTPMKEATVERRPRFA